MGVKPTYQQTPAGLLPDTWECLPMGADVQLLSGHHVLASDCNTAGKGVPYITGPADFPEGVIRHTKYTTKPTTLCRQGDILVTVKGSGTGALAMADREYCISRQLMAIRPTCWDAGYVYATLTRGIESFSQAATGLIPGLSRGDILGRHLAIPPLLEQQAIATALSDVDDLIQSLERLITKKRGLKQATMQQLLTGQTRLPGFSGEWTTCTLGSIGLFTKGKGIRKDQVREFGLPCIRYGEIYTRHNDYIRRFYSFIDTNTAAEAYRLRNGDLLFAGSGETAEEIGKCVAFIGSEEAYAGGDIVVLSPSGHDSQFLGYLMNHPSVAKQKARMGQGDAVCHIGARSLSAVMLHLPERREQAAIAEVLSDMDAEITALEARLAKTRDFKQGMMQELLTGRTRLV